LWGTFLSHICLSVSFARNNFSLFAKNIFWNWSLNSAVKILLPRTISFVYRLYLFCNICQKYFLTVSSSSDPFTPIQLVFCFYRMYVTAYLLCTHRIVTFLLRWCPEACSETFLRKAKQCEVQRGTVKSESFIFCILVITIVAVQCDRLKYYTSTKDLLKKNFI
jgi:hypothetical protein